MNRLRIRLPLALMLLALGAAGTPFAAQDQQPTFEGRVEVREAGIVVEPPEGTSLKAVSPGEILVFEDGTPRTVLKAEPLRPGGGSSPWSLVLYFDQALTGPVTALDASLALARHARELTDLGPVEVVVADPEPRVELASTRDLRSLSGILGEISSKARKDSQRAARAGARPLPDAATLRRQLDRLTVFLAGRPGSGAQALFLVMDGFLPPPGEADLLSSGECKATPPGTAAAALCQTSRVLASYGWVTFAVPLRESPADRDRRETADMERIRIQAGGSKHGSTPPVIPMPPRDRGPLKSQRVVEVFTRPDSAPLLALVQPTAGTVLGVEDQLKPALDNLAGRWRVWYQAPETLDGHLRAVEVRLPTSSAPLRGPRWIRSATPEELGSARARLLAGGNPVPDGTLPLKASLDGSNLVLRLPPAGEGAAGPVRISVVYDNRSEALHTMKPEASLARGWEDRMEIRPPTGARRLAVVVEDLARGAWGGAVVDLAAPGGR